MRFLLAFALLLPAAPAPKVRVQALTLKPGRYVLTWEGDDWSVDLGSDGMLYEEREHYGAWSGEWTYADGKLHVRDSNDGGCSWVEWEMKLWEGSALVWYEDGNGPKSIPVKLRRE